MTGTNLELTKVKHEHLVPNPWNPNKQSERAYQAEIESIADNGFVQPITVRPHPEDKTKYQIVDGYHRWLAIGEFMEGKHEATDKLQPVLDTGLLPCVVLDIDEAQAKKLTVILNETRGRADLGELGQLLDDIKIEFNDDLIRGLPYTENQLNDLLSLAEFDWDNLDDLIEEDEDVDGDMPYRVTADLTPSQEVKWKKIKEQHSGDLPSDSKLANAKLIEILIDNQK